MVDEPHVHLRSGPWSVGEVEAYLTTTVIPIRLATNGSSGWPLVQSVWFLYDDAALWCATQSDAVLARRLRRDPRCAFEVAGDQPPYAGVRGTGTAELRHDGVEPLLRRLIDRYLDDTSSSLASWLLSRVDDEVAIRIGDLRVSSWDYGARMDQG